MNGDADVLVSLDDPTADIAATEPSPLYALSLDTPASAAAVDPFAASTVELNNPDTPTHSTLKNTHNTPVDPMPAAANLSSPSLATAEDGTVPELRPVVIIGPSGVGKGTLVARLMAKHGDHFGFTVSHTTRQPRPGEQDGKDYHFVTSDAMQQAVLGGEFLEHAEVHGNLYGTSIDAVRKVKGEGKTAILEIDVQVLFRIPFSLFSLWQCMLPDSCAL